MEQLPTHTVANRVRAAHTPRGAPGHVWAANGMYLSLLFFDTAKGNLSFHSHFRVGAELTSISACADYDYAVYATTAGCCVRRMLFRVSDGAQFVELTDDRSVFRFRECAARVAALSSGAAVACGDAFRVVLLADGAPVREVRAESVVSALAAGEDTVLVGTVSGRVCVYDGALRERCAVEIGARILGVSVCGGTAIVAAEDGVRTLDVSSGEVLREERTEKDVAYACIEDAEGGRRVALWTCDCRRRASAAVFLGDFLFCFGPAAIEGFEFPQDDESEELLDNALIFDSQE